jgi:mannose-1-phosphate guanylyltransferase
MKDPMVSAAMVLAAGLGTRLRPLTDSRAKPLVPVGDRPALARILEHLREANIERVVVNAHHRAADMRVFLNPWAGVSVSEEPDLLGTAGGVAQASDALGAGDVLVYSADIVAGIDLRRLTEAHAGHGDAATLVIRRRGPGEGNVGVDETGRVVRIRHDGVAEEAHGGEFLAVHVLGAALRRMLPARGCLVGDVYIPALHRGVVLRAHFHAAPFFDIGTPGGYLDANVAWLAEGRVCHWTGAGARVDATVALDRTIVGAGAVVRGSGALARCVVWPGATATAPLADAIVTTREVVRVPGS